MVGAVPNLSSLPSHARCQTIKRQPGRTINRDGQRRPLDALQPGKGGSEIIGQRVVGLAALLGCSAHTAKDAIGRLSKVGLVIKRSDGFTLLEPKEAVRSWWRDRKRRRRVASSRSPRTAINLDGSSRWLPTDMAPSPRISESFSCRMIGKCSRQMLEGRVKPKEAKKYWEEVLRSFPDTDPAIDFGILGWTEIWQDAHRTHASNGRYAGSCINLLTANTRTHLSTPRNEFLSLFS